VTNFPVRTGPVIAEEDATALQRVVTSPSIAREASKPVPQILEALAVFPNARLVGGAGSDEAVVEIFSMTDSPGTRDLL